MIDSNLVMAVLLTPITGQHKYGWCRTLEKATGVQMGAKRPEDIEIEGPSRIAMILHDVSTTGSPFKLILAWLYFKWLVDEFGKAYEPYLRSLWYFKPESFDFDEYQELKDDISSSFVGSYKEEALSLLDSFRENFARNMAD